MGDTVFKSVALTTPYNHGMAMDENGKFLAMRVHTRANLGAYLSTFGTMVPSYLYAFLLAGQYATPLIYSEVKAVYTNTAPVDAAIPRCAR